MIVEYILTQSILINCFFLINYREDICRYIYDSITVYN